MWLVLKKHNNWVLGKRRAAEAARGHIKSATIPPDVDRRLACGEYGSHQIRAQSSVLAYPAFRAAELAGFRFAKQQK